MQFFGDEIMVRFRSGVGSLHQRGMYRGGKSAYGREFAFTEAGFLQIPAPSAFQAGRDRVARAACAFRLALREIPASFHCQHPFLIQPLLTTSLRDLSAPACRQGYAFSKGQTHHGCMTNISFSNYSTHLDLSAAALSCAVIRLEWETRAGCPRILRTRLIFTPDAYIRTVVLL
jgi:hypothetical protein